MRKEEVFKMIDNFSVLTEYVIPRKILMKMLEVYQNLGRTDIYIDNLKDSADLIRKNTLETDTYFYLEFLRNENLLADVSDARLRLLITKDSTPKNQSERMVTNTKAVLELIRLEAAKSKFNSSDILMYLNKILGPNKVKFDMSNYYQKTNTRSSLSLRLAFDRVVEKYYYNLDKKTFEPIMLSLIAFLELRMIKPYKYSGNFDVNKLAAYLMLYYTMFNIKVRSYEITSFYEQIFENLATIEDEIKKATLNYPERFFNLTDFTELVLNLVNESYAELKKITRNYQLEEDVSKSNNIERTIFLMDKQFTKEDIRKSHPYVSDSTIMRVLTKLKNENIIKPLSKGRSAVWIRIIDDNDPRRLFQS